MQGKATQKSSPKENIFGNQHFSFLLAVHARYKQQQHPIETWVKNKKDLNYASDNEAMEAAGFNAEAARASNCLKVKETVERYKEKEMRFSNSFWQKGVWASLF
jgi:hypothetical protein